MVRHAGGWLGMVTGAGVTLAASGIGCSALASTPGFDTQLFAAARAPVKPSLSAPPKLATPLAAGAVRVIAVVGAPHLAQNEIDQATAPFLGQRLSGEDKADLLMAISGLARGKGYLFARSFLPAGADRQGLLRVVVDEGRIDEVRLTGDTGGAAQAVQGVLGKLVGSAPTRAELERQVVLAQDLPGVSLGTARFEREGEGENARGVLVVPVTRKRINARVTLDNWGTRELGPLRVQLAYDLAGLLSARDQLSFSAVVTPANPREMGFLWGRYSYQLDNSGTELSAYAAYGRSQSGGDLRQYDVRGHTLSGGVMLARALIRGRKTSLWVNGGLDYMAVDQNFLGSLARRDRMVMASLSLNGYWPLAGGRLRGGLGVTQGLDMPGATQAGDVLASRAGAGADFTRFNGWASWSGHLAGPFSARLAANAQTSTAPLFAMQQMMIGGPIFGRAYDFAERSGDKGVLGSAELQASLLDTNSGLLRTAQLYTYADGGMVANLRNSDNTGDLASAGVGTRITLAQSFQLAMEAGFPLSAPRTQSGDKTPRLSASLSKAF